MPEKKQTLALVIKVSHSCPKDNEYPTVTFEPYHDPEDESRSWDGYECPKCGVTVYVDLAFKPSK